MKAMQLMSALSQPTRLEVFTRLAAALPKGLAAGDLSAACRTAPSVMSSHLAILSRAGLVASTKAGRNVVYRAKPKPIDDLIAFLSGARGTPGPGSTQLAVPPTKEIPDVPSTRSSTIGT